MDVTAYLLEGDPAIRWQVLHDLVDAPADEVAGARALVETEGWGARLLAEQADDGRWDGGTYKPGWVDDSRPHFDVWTATHFSLQTLMQYGLDPGSDAARTAIERVRASVRWEHEGERYFDGETEPCINGVALAVGAYFGQDAAPIVATVIAGQLPDGGWNCWDEDGTSRSSFHSTLCVLEGLRAWEQASGGSDELRAVRRRGEEFLLDRRLLRRATDGELVDVRFTLASAAPRWYYDYLRALDYFRLARPERDERCAEAVELLRSRMLPFGMWKEENTHQGPRLFAEDAEAEGFPSRWVTLRALRVLRWWDAA